MASSDDFPKRPDTSSFQFASTFQGEDAIRTGEWVLSEEKRYEGQTSRVKVAPCDLDGGAFAGDYGLLLDEDRKHYGVGATLPEPFDNAGKDLVLQYEVQVRGGIKCGGAYVKMLRGDAGKNISTLNEKSPYSVMFGPDRCFRDTDKVHLILQHENPNTNEWEEKHFNNAPKIKTDGGFHVYTLHMKSNDNTFDIYIDTEVVSSGSLLENMEPPLVPVQEIDDPEDEQPEDWVTQAKIPDPSAVKPDDWDEDAPKKIVDEEAEMPEGWLEDEEEIIPDPSSTKPDDWDDEEDGEWHPVMIINKACDEAPGCGKWEKPLVANPAYKGKWSPPKIDNPDYVGTWQPRKIKNPAYFEIENTEPSHVAPITGLAVEIWTVDGGVWLDNFVLGHDIGAALKLAETTWRPKFDAFEAAEAAEKKRKDLERASKKKERDAQLSWNSKMLSASRLLADKARPYVPNAATPALDMAAENPVAVVATLLAGLVAMVVLSVVKRRSSTNNSSSSNNNNNRPRSLAKAAAATGTTPTETSGGDKTANRCDEEDEDVGEDEDKESRGDDEGEGEDDGDDGVDGDDGGEGGEEIRSKEEGVGATTAPEGEAETVAPISST